MTSQLPDRDDDAVVRIALSGQAIAWLGVLVLIILGLFAVVQMEQAEDDAEQEACEYVSEISPTYGEEC